MLRHQGLLEQLGWRGNPRAPEALAAALGCFPLSPNPVDFRLKPVLCFSWPQHLWLSLQLVQWWRWIVVCSQGH